MQVNIHEAKTHLSRLLRQVEAGEEIIIMQTGEPLAAMSEPPKRQKRVPGDMQGKIEIPEDFDEPMPDEWFFTGEDEDPLYT